MKIKPVLIVEDNKDLQEIYKVSFGNAKIPIVIKSTGLEAISELKEINPSLILLDLLMPDIDGFKFMEIMNKETSVRIPVIVCSNLSDKTSVARCNELGCLDYIVKANVDISDIINKVKKFLDENN